MLAIAAMTAGALEQQQSGLLAALSSASLPHLPPPDVRLLIVISNAAQIRTRVVPALLERHGVLLSGEWVGG